MNFIFIRPIRYNYLFIYLFRDFSIEKKQTVTAITGHTSKMRHFITEKDIHGS